MNVPGFKKAIFFTAGFLLFACITQCSSKIDFAEEIEASLPEKIDFNYHIKPILSDRCFACHGPDKNTIEAGLRLDLEETAFAALGERSEERRVGNSVAGV